MNRGPHSLATRARIKASLRVRAADVHATLEAATPALVARLRADAELGPLAAGVADEALASLVVGAGWRKCQRLAKAAAEAGHEGPLWAAAGGGAHPMRSELLRVLERAAAAREAASSGAPRRRRGPRTANGRVRAALKAARQLADARAKLAEAEAAVGTLARARAAFAGDAEKLAAVDAAAARGEAALAKLRAHVAALDEAMAPLAEYLEPGAAGGAGGGSAVAAAAEA
jgi:hypothetical protein